MSSLENRILLRLPQYEFFMTNIRSGAAVSRATIGLRVCEDQMSALRVDAYSIARLEFSFENFPRQWIFELLLNRPFQRTRTIYRIETDIAEQIERLFRQRERELTFGNRFARYSV